MSQRKERKRHPNISQLARELGFTDAAFFSKMLMGFWSKYFPGPQFAGISDEQITKIVDDFLELKGREIWSQKGRGPFFHDDKEDKIKPKLIAVLKRQRRNQLDVGAKKEKKLMGEGDKAFVADAPEGSRHLDTLDPRPQDRISAGSSTQPGPPAGQVLSPDRPTTISPSRSGPHGVAEECNIRARPTPGRNPGKHTSHTSGSTFPKSSSTSQPTTAQENAGLAPTLEPAPSSGGPRVGDGNPHPSSSPRQPSTRTRDPTEPTSVDSVPEDVGTTDMLEDDEHPFASRDGLVQRMCGAPASESDSEIPPGQLVLWRRSPQPGINGADHSLGHEHEMAPLGLATGVADGAVSTEPQAARMSYLILDDVYSIQANQAPTLLESFLQICHECKHVSSKTMWEASTPEARTRLVTVRELLRAFKEEGLRAGARLEF